MLLGFATAAEGAAWAPLFERLRADGRATAVELPGAGTVWVAAERLPEVDVALPGAVAAERLVVLGGAVEDRDTALRELVRSRFEALGPVTAEALAQPFGLAAGDVLPALAALEQQGTAMRGNFTASGAPGEEWCERRLLARIHRYTLKRLRNEIEPATLADYQRFLFHWQGLGAERRQGREALARRARRAARLGVAGRALGARGAAGAHRRLRRAVARSALHGRRDRLVAAAAERRAARRARDDGRDVADRARAARFAAVVALARLVRARARHVGRRRARRASAARARRAVLRRDRAGERPACACRSRKRSASSSRAVVVTADSFTGLRAVLTPQSRRRGFRGRGRLRGSSGFDAAGRWALLPPRTAPRAATDPEALEHVAKTLLRRYGVMCRRLLAREPLARAGASSCRSTARPRRAARSAAAASSSRSAASSSR